MHLTDIAFESVKRRRGRFAFVLAALTLGIGTVVALVSLSRSMQREVGDQLDRLGANIVVTPKSTLLGLGYGAIDIGGVAVDSVELRVADAERIYTILHRRNISAVAPKLLGTADVDGRRALVVGVSFDQERRVKSWWEIEGRPARAADEALLGSEVAESLGKREGDQIHLGGRALKVTGIIRPTGSLDDRAVYADLPLVQSVLGRPEALSLIDVSALCRGCPIDDIVSEIGAVLPNARVAPIRQAVAAREQSVLQMTRFAYAISVVVLLVGALVIMTTMMASVTERTQEIGILRAVGFRRSQVAQLILLEALAVSLAGGMLGWAAGIGAARTFGLSLAQISLPVPVEAWLAWAAVALAAVLGVASGFYPAVKAASMDPSQALRHI